MNAHASGVLLAILAAVLFGASTPLIPIVAGSTGPLTVAGFLYLGAALGALVVRLAGQGAIAGGRPLERRDALTIVGMALCGAAIAPTLLVLGLSQTSTIAAALALNAEVFFTVILAIAFYREPWRGHVVVAMAVMVLGGVALALDQRDIGMTGLVGLLLVIGATLFWGIDNTLSRQVSEAKPLSVVSWKASLGAALTLVLALAFGEPLPSFATLAGLAAIGATGYGASLFVYLLAQRRLGAARTGSIYGFAPFVGASLALALGDRDGSWLTLVAAVLFGIGVWIHTREPHEHNHVHPALAHDHMHRHDDGHHDHSHVPAVAGAHSHHHEHLELGHDHSHAPDIHHRHLHDA